LNCKKDGSAFGFLNLFSKLDTAQKAGNAAKGEVHGPYPWED